MLGVAQEVLKKLREDYPKGTRVELVEMVDTQAVLVGTQGTVTHVDDIGTIHTRWDTGSTLGVVYGIDRVKRV